jgi:UTP--glucose-1-phosphate uridylyltransferase
MDKVKRAIIPAAGLGTRFLPATKAIPKEMIPIVDIPMIQFIVEEAVRSGIEDVILVTARHKEAIENHFDFNYELEDTLEKRHKEELVEASRKVANLCNLITVRQKNPMGLGHAILTAAPIVGNEPFAILLGDDMIDSDVPCTRQLIDVFQKEKTSVVGIMEVPRSETSKYGIVKGQSIRDGLLRVESVVEKPKPEHAPSQFAIPGRYVLDAEIFKLLREVKPGAGGEIQLTDGLQLLAQKKGLLAYRYKGERYDTGDRVGFIDATLEFALRRPELKGSVLELLHKHLKKHGSGGVKA